MKRRARRHAGGSRRTRAVGAAAPLLLLDIGNSRLKWALWQPALTPAPAPARAPARARGQRFVRRGALAIEGLRRSATPLRRLFGGLPAGTRIVGCNVAGARLEARVRVAAAAVALPAPRFVATSARAAGVINGYVEPWRLGVDRWVGLIGAHARWPRRALCLVGIGSALTIDLLAPDGRHLGGCIAPGPQMMIESLLRETAGIRRRAQLSSGAAIARALSAGPMPGVRAAGPAGSLFASSTHTALLAGARHACAALIERAAQQARVHLGQRVQVVLSGGAADAIAPLLRLTCRREDDLVLQGLAVLARARSPRPIA